MEILNGSKFGKELTKICIQSFSLHANHITGNIRLKEVLKPELKLLEEMLAAGSKEKLRNI